MERAHCSIDALQEGIDFDYYLTRQRFEGACTKIYDSCLTPIDELLSKNNLTNESIDKVKIKISILLLFLLFQLNFKFT